MTAIMPERPDVDLNALRRDLVAVLAVHGLTGLDTVSVAVSEIEQGGEFAGFSFSGLVYERPSHLPPAGECSPTGGEGFAALAARLRGAA